MNGFLATGLLAAMLGALEQRTVLPSGTEILQKVEERLAEVRDYVVTLDIVTDVEQVSVPPGRAVMYFKYPDKVRFAAEGFALVPRDAIALTPSRLLQRFSIKRVEKEMIDGEQSYRLTLKSNDEGNRIRSADVSVNARRWTIDRISAALSDHRMLEARFEHRLTANHWLPALLTVTFTAPPDDRGEISAPDDQNIVPSRRPAVRNGTLTVRYSDYRVSTGLSDSLFTAEPSPH